MSDRLLELEQKNLNPQSPARENSSILALVYRFVIVTSLASSVLAVIIFAFVFFFTPQLEYLSDVIATRTNTTSKVLGAQTNNKDDSILGRIVKVILSPIGRANIWLINLAAVDNPSVLDPLLTTELNEVFEYDASGNKVIVKKELVFEDEAATETSINWANITGAPDFLTALNELTGDDGNIDLVEGDNIEITSNKSKNTLTIAGTLVSSSPGISEINLTAGTGISISGTSPDFTIANTNLGSSQNIFKRVAVSGQNTIVADSNNDILTFAAGANMAITTSAGNDRVTFAVTGSVANADTLDLLDSTQFLRSDASDSFTSGTLTTDAGTTLDVNGTLAWGGATISEALNMNSNNITGLGTNLTASAGLTIASSGAGALSLDSASGTVSIAAADILSNGTWSISAAGVGTSLTANDLSCTDCLNATEIENIYLLTTGGVVAGALTVSTGALTVSTGQSTGAMIDTFMAMFNTIPSAGATVVVLDAELVPRFTASPTWLKNIQTSFAEESAAGGLTVANYAALYVEGPLLDDADLTVTNPYGLYIEDFCANGDAACPGNVATFTNTPYAIYQAGADDENYFGGNVGIGDSTPTESLTVADDFVGYAGSFFNDGNLDTHEGVFIQACLDTSPTAACNFLELRDGNGTILGAIEGNGAGGVTNASAGSDYAELFAGDLASFEAGDVIALGAAGDVEKAGEDSTLLGVFSTNSNNLGNWQDGWEETGSWVPVGLLGQIKTKVSTENGPIEIGDPLTSSSTQGVAMKATKSGPTIGKALESYTGTGTGKIMVFVSVGWYVAPVGADVSSQMSDLSEINTETLTAGTIHTDVLFIGDRKLDMTEDGTLVIDGRVNILGDVIIEGDAEITGELTAKKLNVGEEAAGSAVLEAGETKVVVETQAVAGKSQVLITPNTLSEKNLTVTKKEAEKGFTVEIINPEAKDIEFDWLIIN